MPKAKPPMPPEQPWPLPDDEADFIRETVERVLGSDTVVRSFGTDPSSLVLHVETSGGVGLELDDCKGHLMCRIERPIYLVATKRGRRIYGAAKIAYRQGVIL